MTYPTPAGPVDRELIINKSRFIAWLRPVQDRDQAQAVLEQARARYPDASHHCPIDGVGGGGEVGTHPRDQPRPALACVPRLLPARPLTRPLCP